MASLDEIVDRVAADGWCAAPGFLPAAALDALLAESTRLDEAGGFRPAGVGRGSAPMRDSAVRGDRILWLDPEAPSEAQSLYRARVAALRSAFNERLFLGLVELEAHLAIYAAGAAYPTHLDRFSDADERTISLSLYLHQGWRQEHGGHLRMHLAAGPVDVLPVQGTLVAFRSDTVPHEVLPATRDRYSLTGWLKRRAIGRPAL